ncbi:MAG: hypothetical protein LLG97_19355 [Deltaproteobacteria bacterium]|nr:hypothetical protein [Deltaproteobacteria bacterium]
MADEKLRLILEAYNKSKPAFDELDKQFQNVQRGVDRTNSVLQLMKTHWLGLSAVAVTVGIGIHKAMEYIDLGAKAIRAEESFKAMADAGEVNADRLRASMKRAADGMIDDSDLMQRAAFAMAQDIDPNKIPQLLEAARIAARKTGRDVGDAVDGMVQGIATNMPRSLRQMGAITKEQMALLNKAAAEGVTEIDLLDLVLANAAVDAAKLGPAANNAAKDIARFKVQITEVKEAIGGGLLTVLQKAFGAFQWLAAGILTAASAGPKLLEMMARLAAKVYDTTGQKERAAGALKEAESLLQTYKDLNGAAEDLTGKAVENMTGSGGGGDTRTPEQKRRDIAKAEADRAREEQKLRNAAAARERLRDEEKAGKERTDMLVQLWDTINRINEAKAKEDADFFAKQDEEKRKREEDAYRKSMAEFGAREEENAQYLKEMPARLKAEREGEINQQIAELDLAEKLGRAHSDTLTERIRLLEELRRSQEQSLAGIDKEKDPTGWYAQAAAIQATNGAIADLSREIALRDPFTAIDLGLKKVANEAENVGQKLYDAIDRAFEGMTDSLADFVMTGKLDFADLANSIIRDMVRIQIQQSVTGPLARAGGAWLSGLFASRPGYNVGIDAAFEGASGMHTGGAVGGRGGAYRIVINPDLLPRRHGGGLAADERVIINKVGERYITEEQNEWLTAVARSAGGRSPQAVTFNVVNESGQEVQARDARVDFNAQEMVVTLWLDALNRNKFGLRNALGG